jgi:membrane protease YdiL (CAAX protease family)
VSPFTSSQIALLAAPPVLLGTTYFAYKELATRLGPARGYLVGFLFYWVCWCFLLSLLTVGIDGLREMFRVPQPMFGKPNWLGLLLLLGPPLVMYVTTFPVEVKGAGLRVIIYSILFALVNGAMEEVLWRGAYITAFPNSWLWAYLYPSMWFGLWHLSPQVVHPSEMAGGAIAFALMSICLGLVWGWVAKTTGSIRWTVVAHILLNFAGLAGRSFL